ncbi:MAG: hypothetical protein Q9169_007382, partial [Polycauliona sp. 2 TL-2023]
MHLLSPSTILPFLSLFSIGAIVQGSGTGPNRFVGRTEDVGWCFNNEGVWRTQDIRALRKIFHEPPIQKYPMRPWSYRYWDHGSMRLCLQNKFLDRSTTISSEKVALALDIIYLECCDPAEEYCGGGYIQEHGIGGAIRHKDLPLDFETKHGGEDCEGHMTDVLGSQI